MSNDILLPPRRFVSIHNHSHFSSYDAIGHPHEHINFCIKNELDGWALTDHGNGNGLAHAHAHAKKLYKNGQKFRQIFGVEFYFVNSLKEWKKTYEQKKNGVKEEEQSLDEDESGGLTVEDADETRSEVATNDLLKRYHLVVIAKNRVGLSNLFQLVKKSYVDGFYRFPRIDFELLKQHSEGLIVSTACVGGTAASAAYKEFPGLKFDQLTPDLVDDETVRKNVVGKLENLVDRFVDCVGQENFFLELQFNKLNAQDLSNRCVIDAAQKTGTRLISTADSHFPGPELWEAREIYRMLLPGRMKVGEAAKIPKKEELKTLLYPKNAQQMWDEFLESRQRHSWYQGKEDVVRTSIETGYDVAWDACEQVWFDTRVKLPNFATPEKTESQQLEELVNQALLDSGLSDKPEYVERAKMELEDIKFLKFESYFLTLQKVFKVSDNRTLPGAGRGSGAGSLVNFLLGITHVDPVKYGLLFERFISRQKASWPDVDCLLSSHLIATPAGLKPLSEIQINDTVFDVKMQKCKVLNVIHRNIRHDEVVFDVFVKDANGVYGCITANSKHRLLNVYCEEVAVDDIAPHDLLLTNQKTPAVVIAKILYTGNESKLTDITVENGHTFFVVPFDVSEISFANDEKKLHCVHIYGVDTDNIEKVAQQCLIESH